MRVADERSHLCRADDVDFVVADSQTHEFEAGSFDVVISQFGLRFVDDPIAAFSNLLRAMTVDGRIVFSTWRKPR